MLQPLDVSSEKPKQMHDFCARAGFWVIILKLSGMPFWFDEEAFRAGAVPTVQIVKTTLRN